MLIQERIQVILKMHHLTPSAFADKIGVQRSSISHVLSGRNKPGLDFLEKILLHFPRVNAHWLITGKVSDSKNVVQVNESSQESKVVQGAINKERVLLDSCQIEKVLIFYADGTFTTHVPSAE